MGLGRYRTEDVDPNHVKHDDAAEEFNFGNGFIGRKPTKEYAFLSVVNEEGLAKKLRQSRSSIEKV